MTSYVSFTFGLGWEVHRAGCSDVTRKLRGRDESEYEIYAFEAINGLAALEHILELWEDENLNGETREERLQYLKLINCAV